MQTLPQATTQKNKMIMIHHSWFIEPCYNVIYRDGTLTVLSSSPRKKGQAMTQSLDNSGYLRTSLGGSSIHIHRIITQHFLGTRPDGFTVNHKDGKKQNNRIENLEYLSRADNNRHARATGLNPIIRGIESPAYKHGRSLHADYKRDYNKAYYLAHKNKTTTVTIHE
jgi:hypothetical protein